MNTPTLPEAITDYRIISLEHLTASKANPRTRFDETKLAELAASIKQQGILQPLLVREISAPTGRPSGGWPFPTRDTGAPSDNPISPPVATLHFEIIAGERRYRAAKLAGLIDVPCFVRNLTDLQVLHAQVIENLQRDDLHPMEEAEGYDRLMKDHGSTAESLAGEIGKSKGYIYARLKLCALVPEAREAFYAGDLDASTALLIARIPVGKLQVQAVKKITDRDAYHDRPMSFRAARDYIQQEFMLDLDRAPFPITDAKLLNKVGACTDCPKRTGNQPELFDDVSNKDVCTDPVCFAMKKTANILAIQKEAEEKGQLVIRGKDAKKILPYGQYNTTPAEDSGLIKLSDRCPHDAQGRSWEQTLGKKSFEPAKDTGKPAVQKVLVENTHKGEMVPTIKLEDAIKALREMGMEVKPAKNGLQRDNKDQEKMKAKVEQAKAYRQRLFDALHYQIEADLHDILGPKIPVGLYRILAQRMFERFTDYSEAAFLVKIYTPDAIGEEQELIDQFNEKITTLTTQQHFQLIMDILIAGELETGHWNQDKQPETMVDIAKEIGIDPSAIEKEVAAEAAAALAEAKKAKAKTSPPPKPAAQAKALGEAAGDETPATSPSEKKPKPKAKMNAATAA